MKSNEILPNTSQADLYEMSNVPTRLTGLKTVVFCSPKGHAKHECRIKVSNALGKMNETDTFSMRVDNLEVIGHCKLSHDNLEAVRWWVHKNRFLLVKYWNDEVDTLEFLQSIKNLKK